MMTMKMMMSKKITTTLSVVISMKPTLTVTKIVLYIAGGPSEEEALAAEKIRVQKEALVSQDEIAEDTLGDEEWSVISAAE
jgi:hypothetical protein